MDLVGLEHLFSELLVASVLDSVDLKSMRVGVHVMVLCEQVADRVEGGNDAADHANHDLLVWRFVLTKVSKILRHIMGHLRSRRGSSIFVLDHAVVELRGHSNDHVIIVGVEITTLGNVQTEGSIVVITSKQVVRIVDQAWLMSVCL